MALVKLLIKLGSARRSHYAPYPDHIWSRHSALLDAAWRVSKRHSGAA